MSEPRSETEQRFYAMQASVRGDEWALVEQRFGHDGSFDQTPIGYVRRMESDRGFVEWVGHLHLGYSRHRWVINAATPEEVVSALWHARPLTTTTYTTQGGGWTSTLIARSATANLCGDFTPHPDDLHCVTCGWDAAAHIGSSKAEAGE